MEYVLKTTALQKKYGNLTVLNNVNMHIPEGAIYGFVAVQSGVSGLMSSRRADLETGRSGFCISFFKIAVSVLVNTPVIILSARAGLDEKVDMLLGGAVDYIFIRESILISNFIKLIMSQTAFLSI